MSPKRFDPFALLLDLNHYCFDDRETWLRMSLHKKIFSFKFLVTWCSYPASRSRGKYQRQYGNLKGLFHTQLKIQMNIPMSMVQWLLTHDGLASEISGTALSWVIKSFQKNWIKEIKTTLCCLPPFPSQTISTLSTPLAWPALPYDEVGGAHQKFWIKPLKETNLSMA